MCYAFQDTGLDVTLAIPAGTRNTSESEMRQIARQKLGKAPNFKLKHLQNFTIAGRGQALGTYFGVKSVLKQTDADVCFARTGFTAHLAVTGGIKTIFEAHGAVINGRSKRIDGIYRRCLLSDTKSSDLALFVTISDALADVWKNRGVPAEKILALHDGFSADDYKSCTSQTHARKFLGIKSEKKIAVYAGSLYEDRGIENLLLLAKTFANVDFYVVGGPEKNKLFYEQEALRQDVSNVTFVGTVPHHKVRDYLFAADVLLMLYTDKVPTIDICSPLKAFEYMAAGRIIVGPAFPTIKEVLSDGCNALLAEVNSYSELENKMHQALAMEYPNKMAENARNLAFEKYSWNMRAQAIMKELHKDQTQ